jgi:hypothetical protein
MDRMKSKGMSDLEVITDPEEIRIVSTEEVFDRDFDQPVSARNRTRLKKMLRVFSINGERFPTMRPRTDPTRAATQDQLWSRLNLIAEEIKAGSVELEPLAEWVRGTGAAEKIGPLVQQSVGRLFVEGFTSTDESWAAACVILEASSSSNVLKMVWWRITGKLERAKSLLSAMVSGDLSAVNGIGVALHHIVDGLNKMRQLAADPARTQWATEDIVDKCLFAPGSVIRRAKTDGEVRGCPFKKGSLFVLALGTASKDRANRDLVFLSQSWSRCPAERWVPALLEGVWRRAQARQLATSSTSA